MGTQPIKVWGWPAHQGRWVFIPLGLLVMLALGTALGGILVGMGYILASWATHGSFLVLTYGAIAGTGIGMGCRCWWCPGGFPIAVVGFGLSPLVTAPLANYWLAVYTVRPTLRLFGMALMGLILCWPLPSSYRPQAGSRQPVPWPLWAPPQPRPLSCEAACFMGCGFATPSEPGWV